MGIMDMFRSATPMPSQAVPGIPPQQQQAAALPQPGNLPAAQTPEMKQADSGKAPGTDIEKSLAAGFGDLWQIPSTQRGIEPQPIKFNIDPAKVRQAAGQYDFTKVVTPELMEKINAGGTEAMSAMLAAMNAMGQEVFTQSSIASGMVTERASEAARLRALEGVPGLVRSQNVRNALREDNPLFQDPATAPMLQMLEQQALQKFPNATAQQISDYAKQYLLSFATNAQKLLGEPTPANKALDARGKEIDWSNVPIFGN